MKYSERNTMGDKFIFFLFGLMIGFDFLSGIDFMVNVSDIAAQYIPAINKMALAHKYPEKMKVVLAFSWIVFPFLFPIYMKMTNGGNIVTRAPTKDKRQLKIAIFILALCVCFSIWVVIFGVFDPFNPLDERVTWGESVYRDSMFGGILFVWAAWSVVYGGIGYFIHLIRS